ncbi:unnamed protein product [Trichobilharzia szidati]|nr:unnamed protein product [Trichobilharzia szidati]
MRCLLAFALLFSVISANPGYKKWSDLQPSVSLSQLLEQKSLKDGVFSSENLEMFTSIDAAWKIFKARFNRAYKNIQEEAKRFLIFGANFIEMMEHNRAHREGKVSYEMGVNEFSDKTEHELRKLRGYKPLKGPSKPEGSTYIRSEHTMLPNKVDWRKEGAVTPIKNQGNCGSCWAFSSTGAIEGQHYRKTKKLVSLSEQQLVDCSGHYGNNGCNGGLMNFAFTYVKDNEGIDSEVSYPYISGATGEQNDKCLFNSSNIAAQVTGFINISPGDEYALMDAVATKGPVSVAINAGLPSFPRYKSGVYSDPECLGEEDNLDHGVLVVGYGEENGQPYWLVKNSWGPEWGEGGYIKILRNKHNMCGIATAASYPLV